jgi:hypothetical protein
VDLEGTHFVISLKIKVEGFSSGWNFSCELVLMLVDFILIIIEAISFIVIAGVVMRLGLVFEFRHLSFTIQAEHLYHQMAGPNQQ